MSKVDQKRHSKEQRKLALSRSASLTSVIFVSGISSEPSSVSASSTGISSISRTLSRYETQGSPPII